MGAHPSTLPISFLTAVPSTVSCLRCFWRSASSCFSEGGEVWALCSEPTYRSSSFPLLRGKYALVRLHGCVFQAMGQGLRRSCDASDRFDRSQSIRGS